VSVALRFELNGEPRALEVDASATLLAVLREQCGLTGTKYGCGLGECGACTVHLDGRPVLACLTPVLQAGGARVTTVEGIGRDGLTRLQAALAEVPHPTADDVRQRLVGNVCRCTGYTKIVEAILDAAGRAGG
jgi:aerobic-type carbon monoxide dehydrogenase small subunit (CoxS/CutS family)